MSWSLPRTCFSCQNYKQVGFTDDHLTHNLKKQRYGLCGKKGCHVFWNELPCSLFIQETGITTHQCKSRSETLIPHQDVPL